MRKLLSHLLTLVCLAFMTSCGSTEAGSPEQAVLRVAVTTSTRDSGLLDVLNPIFESQNGVRLDVIAVGTGAALELGEAGDVDAVLVHARASELAFMAAGHGDRRVEVMYNQFEFLGPPTDPAKIRGLEPSDALQAIAQQQHTFVSRGDKSGTHQRELLLWKAVGGKLAWDNYLESGQGMGATLIVADQKQAYTLCDRGTYLKFKEKIDLRPLLQSQSALRNGYGAIVVNSTKHDKRKHDLANHYVDFLISPAAQQLIRDYQLDGEPLFHPLHSTTGSQ